MKKIIEKLKSIFKNQKQVTAIIYLLTIVLAFGTGFFIRPYIKFDNKYQQPQPTFTPIPKPLDRFSRIQIYDSFNLGLHTSGKIVFENEQGTFISDILGDNQKQLLDNDPINRKSFITMDQSVKYFYYSLLKDDTEYVYKKGLNEGKEQEVFRFAVDDKNKEFFGTNVAVSPDEKWLAIADKDGLILYSLINKQTKALAKNQNECNKSFATCNKYTKPLFSANNSYLKTTKILYEGAVVEIFDTATLQTIAKDYPAGEFVWSKEKNNLAIAGNGYGSGGIAMTAFPGNKPDNLSDIYKDIENSPVQNIDWYRNQKLIFAYSPDDSINGNSHGSSLRVVSYDQTKGSFKTIFDLSSDPGSYQDQEIWLPQGDGIIFKNYKQEVWIIREDGISKAKLPFKANKILLVQ